MRFVLRPLVVIIYVISMFTSTVRDFTRFGRHLFISGNKKILKTPHTVHLIGFMSILPKTESYDLHKIHAVLTCMAYYLKVPRIKQKLLFFFRKIKNCTEIFHTRSEGLYIINIECYHHYD